MVSQVRHPEWRQSLEETKYPFEPSAPLINAAGKEIPPDSFLDAHLYPIGGGASMYLSKVVVTTASVTFHIGDASTDSLASGSISNSEPFSSVRLKDSYGRPAGILVSETFRLGVFWSFGNGTHEFSSTMSPFVATVCMPTPQIGVRGVQLPDGSLLTGPVWLVGEDGVVFTKETSEEPATCDAAAKTLDVIRIDVVGDPLFKRRLCDPKALFTTPNFIKQIKVINGSAEWTCSPDDRGFFSIQGNDSLAGDAALRVRIDSDGGLEFFVAGSSNTDM
jgi:hypothetical protein